VLATVAFLKVELASISELEQVVLGGYLAGLRDAGWHPDPKVVRLGYTAASVLRWSFMYAWQLVNMALEKERWGTYWERRIGIPAEDIIVLIAGLERFLLDLGDEALDLLVRIPACQRMGNE